MVSPVIAVTLSQSMLVVVMGPIISSRQLVKEIYGGVGSKLSNLLNKNYVDEVERKVFFIFCSILRQI